MAKKRIKWKKMAIKTFEETIKKSIELSFLLLLAGISLKYFFALPGVMLGSAVSKTVKIKFLDG